VQLITRRRKLAAGAAGLRGDHRQRFEQDDNAGDVQVEEAAVSGRAAPG
jgi:hypothetical protein